jgi:hypothetical protein
VKGRKWGKAGGGSELENSGMSKGGATDKSFSVPQSSVAEQNTLFLEQFTIEMP